MEDRESAEKRFGVPFGRLLAAGLYSALPFLIAVSCLGILARQTGIEDICSAWESADKAVPPVTFLWLIVPAACTAGLAAASFRPLGIRFAAGTAVSAGYWGLAAISPVLLCGALFVLALLLAMQIRRAAQGEMLGSVAVGAILTGIVSVAAYYRHWALFIELPGKLSPDATTYLAIAKTASGYGTNSREPLFIWLIQLAAQFTGAYSPATLRLLTVAVSLVCVSIVFEFTRRSIGLIAAAAAGFLYAYDLAFIYTAVRGMREEVIIAAFLLFIWACRRTLRLGPALGNCALIGVAGAMLLLVRLNSLFFVLAATALVFAFSAQKHRLRFRKWWLMLVPAAVAFVPTLPYLAYCKRTFGDPMFASSIHVRFYANVEFAGERPDFPAAKEVEKDGYAGGPITMKQYVFGYHRPGEVIGRVVRGAGRMFLGDYARVGLGIATSPYLGEFGKLWFSRVPYVPVPRALYAVHLLGLSSMFLPGRRVLFLLVLLFHAPVFFLASLPDFDWRLLTAGFASFLIGIGGLLQFISEEAGSALASRQRAGYNEEMSDSPERRDGSCSPESQG